MNSEGRGTEVKLGDNTAETPCQRFKPHALVDGILPPGVEPGVYDVASASSLFSFCESLCQTGGSWYPLPCPVSGYQLTAVQAIVNEASMIAGYEHALDRIRLRLRPSPLLDTAAVIEGAGKRLVLSYFSEQFLGPSIADAYWGPSTFYCFHGPRRGLLDMMCKYGMAFRSADAGKFGVGCYSTLNVEYAVRCSHGAFDDESRRRPASPDGKFPVVMFAAYVGRVYPVTRETDYCCTESGHSDFFGGPLKTGFDCHIACVNEKTGFQAVNREECQYVEVVIDQATQLLPVAVLWFEEEDCVLK
jgi:hypothetical protein